MCNFSCATSSSSVTVYGSDRPRKFSFCSDADSAKHAMHCTDASCRRLGVLSFSGLASPQLQARRHWSQCLQTSLVDRGASDDGLAALEVAAAGMQWHGKAAGRA
jgi:hypothetical protein